MCARIFDTLIKLLLLLLMMMMMIPQTKLFKNLRKIGLYSIGIV